jgi:hypothetical protein
LYVWSIKSRGHGGCVVLGLDTAYHLDQGDEGCQSSDVAWEIGGTWELTQWRAETASAPHRPNRCTSGKRRSGLIEVAEIVEVDRVVAVTVCGCSSRERRGGRVEVAEVVELNRVVSVPVGG